MPHASRHPLSLTAQTVQAVLRGETLPTDLDYERFGEYHELVINLNLLAGIDPYEAQKFWAEVSLDVPQLAMQVDGIASEGIVHPKDLFEEFHDWYHHGIPLGISTGFRTLDPYYRVQLGESTVITGTSGAGKSRLLTAIMVNMAARNDWNFLIFSPEMSPPKRH